MNLQDLRDLHTTLDQSLQAYAIKYFALGLVEELLDTDEIEPIDTQIFLNECQDEVKNQELQIELTTDSHLVVNYTAFCEFEWHTVDETENGLGKKGDVADVDTYWADIQKIELFLFDGSIFDLTEELRETITKALAE